MDSTPRLWTAPPDAPPLPEHGVHVWLVDIGRTPPADASAALSNEEQARAARLRPVLRQRYINAQWQLRTLLAPYVGASPEELRFARGRHGKPHLIAPSTAAVHFNLSHSRDHALVAIASRAVGVDLEYHRSVDALRLARRFFSVAEAKSLAQWPPERRLEAFFRLWTCKEALGKAAGIGIRGVLDGLQVETRPHGYRWQSRVPELLPADWLLLPLPPVPGYTATLAVAAGRCQLHCWRAP